MRCDDVCIRLIYVYLLLSKLRIIQEHFYTYFNILIHAQTEIKQNRESILCQNIKLNDNVKQHIYCY